MTPARRPRPSPVPLAERTGRPSRLVRARARARLQAHDHARTGSIASIVSIGAGVVLFALAAIATPLAGADTAAPAPAAATPSQSFAPLQIVPAPATLAPPAPAVNRVLPRGPALAMRQAPVTTAVISGLAANGIPKTALNAYRVAAARMAGVQPGCGIDWTLLAGIGREESDHGRFAGAVLHTDGTSTPRIIGPALDGKHWDYIPAPGNGKALDGDAVYAHALGPMQFIPSTWASYGADANGDGKADIFNINDAALGTARYLCAAGGDLRTHAGQVAAVLTYNHSDQYLAQVLALADAYRRGVPISGLPVGITKGALPKVIDTGYIPPANPGGPTANEPKKASPTPAPTAPRPAKSSSTRTSAPAPRPATSPAPAPRPTSSTPTSARPSPTTPAPSPTASCAPLQHLVGAC
ncbi:MAG TPA: lytic murein transglycosylase, partial [Jatrophihabitans sp.]|jgi:membrane-bound lytic murein transglycosylase B|uniref:lytic transglycosylase domain-containing protein n=1 Tax=Jatrophihabitans sp. TaxID=1932789 RepID=UPI002DFF7EF8|nr:lytic murein transglycosylase [Jatrophihabitans sp.]